jgi:hypothetical protein
MIKTIILITIYILLSVLICGLYFIILPSYLMAKIEKYYNIEFPITTILLTYVLWALINLTTLYLLL